MDFKDKHALITGGANGIGRCVAETFIREGENITIDGGMSLSPEIISTITGLSIEEINRILEKYKSNN